MVSDKECAFFSYFANLRLCNAAFQKIRRDRESCPCELREGLWKPRCHRRRRRPKSSNSFYIFDFSDVTFSNLIIIALLIDYNPGFGRWSRNGEAPGKL